MKKHLLGVSLIAGHLTATVFHKGKPGSTWQCPGRVASAEAFAQALKEAKRQTDFRGRYVSFVVETEEASHAFFKTPPMRRRDLEIFLARKSEQNKPFAEPAVHCFEQTKEPTGEGVLLHMLPESYFHTIMQACVELGLTPLQWFPPSAVLRRSLEHLPIADKEVTLLVVSTAGTATMVFGDGQGALLFARHLMFHDEHSGERLLREINRSTLYVKQQFGVIVRRGWLAGEVAALAEDASSLSEIKLAVLPGKPGGFPWIEQSIAMPVKNESNLIPYEIHDERERLLRVRVSAAAIALLLMASLASTVLIESLLAKQQGVAAAMMQEYSEQLQERRMLKKRQDDLIGLRHFIRRVEMRKPPLPGWYAGYLADSVPAGMVLDEVAVIYQENGWKVRISGVASGEQAFAWAAQLQRFEQALSGPPYYLNISRGWREGWLKKIRGEGQLPMTSRMAFSIEGEIR
ncbi:MAG: hypothetical protein R8K46_07590 [Mariprofundaceae bacterium]